MKWMKKLIGIKMEIAKIPFDHHDVTAVEYRAWAGAVILRYVQ